MPTPEQRKAILAQDGVRCLDSTQFLTKTGVQITVQGDSYRSLTDPDHPDPRTERERRVYRVSAPEGTVTLIPAGFGLLTEAEVIGLVSDENFLAVH